MEILLIIYMCFAKVAAKQKIASGHPSLQEAFALHWNFTPTHKQYHLQVSLAFVHNDICTVNLIGQLLINVNNISQASSVFTGHSHMLASGKRKWSI